MFLARFKPDLAPFKHSRDFRLLYLGQAGSSAGAMICYVALPYQAYRISHSSLVVGLLSIAELLPVLLAGLVGGSLADALERRKLILITQAITIGCAAVLVTNALFWRQLWLLFVLAGLLAGAFGMQRPSVEVLVRGWCRTTTCRRRPPWPAFSALSPRPAGRCWPAAC
jgi:MFS family permease